MKILISFLLAIFINLSFAPIAIASSVFDVMDAMVDEQDEWIEEGHEAYEESLDAYDNEDYQLAFRKSKKAAIRGVLPAKYNIGLQYLYGDGIRKSRRKAIKWFREAASEGHKGSQRKLDELDHLNEPSKNGYR